MQGQFWRNDEPGFFTLYSVGGRATVTREFGGRQSAVFGSRAPTTLSLTYANEWEDYTISNEALEDFELRDDLIALGLDPRFGTGQGQRSAISIDGGRNTTNNVLDAKRGYVASLHLEQAGAWLGGDYDYYEFTGEGRYYLSLADRAVVAVMARGGTIDDLGSNGVLQVPFYKRYFLGGATNLRGWGRFDVAPLSGAGFPLGGHSFANFSAEVRVPLFGNLGGVLFFDGGNVWSDPWGLRHERFALRRRAGHPLQHADWPDSRRSRVSAESDPGAPHQRRAGAAALPLPLQHRAGVLAMRAVRKLLQVVALVGTLLVGILSLALIVSQTPWFRDWVRRYIVRESKQYLNGELSIGRIGGNLLFGVQVSDIAVDVSGERVIAAKSLEVDYSIIEIISQGVVINEIKLVAPTVRLERDARGWNLARLVKEQAQEADREGPGAPLSLQSIELVDGDITIADSQAAASGMQLPARIEDLDLKASYEYAPVHYTVVVDRASFRASSPAFQLTSLQGKVAVRDDNLYVDQLSVRTGESTMNVDGVIEDYLGTPVLKVTTTGQVSLPEIGRIVTAAGGYELHPAIDVKASGPIEKLGLDIDVRSEAGNITGVLTADVGAPALGAQGEITLEGLNLAPLLKDPAQRSDITGRAELDLRVAPEPQAAPITDRLAGTFTFTGPAVTAAGYTARDVRVTGTFEGPRLTLDARAAAYGGTATAKGFIGLPAEDRPLAFELRGSANRVDLQDLPAETGAPALSTNLSVAEYQVSGKGSTIAGSVRLNESVVEGATLGDGTVAEFTAAPAAVSFGARGTVADLNLARLGKAMEIAALDDPAYDGRVNGDFDVTGSLPKAAGPRAKADGDMTIDATGTLRDSSLMGGRLPQLAFEAHLAGGGLTVAADGRFEGFNPGTLANRKELEGTVSGAVDLEARVADIDAPITPESITADGRVTLERSEVGGLRIDSAAVEGKYAQQVADLARLQVSGPDLKVDASGRVALDRTSASNLTYHVEALGLAELARLAGQEGVAGSAILDGTLTGNAASLATTGTLDGSNLGYQENTALDLNTQVLRHDTRADVRGGGGQGRHHGNVPQGRRPRDQRPDRHHDLRRRPRQLHDEHPGEDPGADGDRGRHPAHGSPGSAPAGTRRPDQRRRVADGGDPAGRTDHHRGGRQLGGHHQVRPGPDRARERAAGQRRPVPRPRRRVCAQGRHAGRRHQGPGAERRSPAARTAAAAGPRHRRAAVRGGDGVGNGGGAGRGRARGGAERHLPDLQVRLPDGRRGLLRAAHRD